MKPLDIELFSAAFFACSMMAVAIVVFFVERRLSRERRELEEHRKLLFGSESLEFSSLKKAAAPLVDWLKDHGDPHTIAIVSQTNVDVYQAAAGDVFPAAD